MLLTDARRAARTGPAGELIPLAEQDRALLGSPPPSPRAWRWSATRCRAAPSAPTSCRRRSPPCTTKPRTVDDTDWPQILALYGLLERMSDNPMVTLNRVVAQAMVQGPQAALAALAPLDTTGRLAGHHRLHSVRAHLLEMAGDREAAVEHYRIAAGKTASVPEQRYLLTQAARLATATA